MNFLKIIFSSAFTFLFFNNNCFAQPEPAPKPEYVKQIADWASTLQRAKTENKLIFIDVYFTGCFPCAQMDKDVFPNEIVASALQKNFIPVSTDILKDATGDSILKKYFVRGFPTFLILSTDGNLIDRFSGYKDAGMLTEKLQQAIVFNNQQKYLKGYSADINNNAPQMYLNLFDRENQQRLDSALANQWILDNRQAKPEAAAMLFIAVNKPSLSLSTEFINQGKMFSELFGSELTINKAADILGKILNQQAAKMSDNSFSDFLNKYQNNFPHEDWAAIKSILANNYYCVAKKDTTGYLKFMTKNPVIYQNYFGAFYNNMQVKKQLTPEHLALLAEWGLKGINDNSAFDIMTSVANILKSMGKAEESKKVIQRIINKCKTYKVDSGKYEKMLNG